MPAPLPRPAVRSLSITFLLATTLLLCGGQAAAPATQPADRAPLREQTIYIPFEKLRDVFEREGRGVFLPYDEFRVLWKAARDAQTAPPEIGPPVAAMITEAHSEATVAFDVVRVAATLRIEVLRAGWHEVPLRLGDAAITAARIDGQPARILAGEHGYRLLLETTAERAAAVELELEYAKAFRKAPGRNSISFQAPQAPVNRWRVRVAEAGVKVNIHPLIAATELHADAESEASAETNVLAFVGSAPEVRIDWTPRAEGATGLQALVTVRTDQRSAIHEGVSRTRATLTYSISRAALEHLVLEVPADQRVVSVFDANVREWTVTRADDRQRIDVALFEAALGTQQIVVELERFRADEDRTEVDLPQVRAVDAARQLGVLAVAVADGLRMEPTGRSGLMQVDTSELAEAAHAPGAGDWSLAYRYVSVPYALTLRVEKIQPRIGVETLLDVRLEPERLRVELLATYTIERAGVFQLAVDLPDGYEVREPRGVAHGAAAPAVIESWHRDENRLIVNLARKAFGRIGFALTLTQALTDPDLQAPTGNTARVPIDLPRVAQVDRTSGTVLVHAAPSLRVNPGPLRGLRDLPVAEALQGSAPRPAGAATPDLAFGFADEPAALELRVERRRPHVTVRQLLAARIESGVVHYNATLLYDIRYSEVDDLRVDIPADLRDRIQITTPGVREQLPEDPTPAPADGYVAWSLRGGGDLIGTRRIDLSWETRVEAPGIGQHVTIDLPHLRPVGVDRAWGQIVLAKAETIDMRAVEDPAGGGPRGLRPIDPQHDLMDIGSAWRGAARAFEFHDDWSLQVTATRYELEEVKRTSIERGLVRHVITRSGQISTQALYRLRSGRQRLPINLPAGVQFDTQPVRINGRPVALERGAGQEFFVPLVGLTPEAPFVLEIRYALPDGGTLLSCPDFPTDPAVQKVYLSAYLPREWTLLGSTGPWTDELRWPWVPLRGFEPRARSTDNQLVSWVTADCAVTGDPLQSLQTDGRHYLYATLRPQAPPAGALRLVTVHQTVLRGAVLAAIAAFGLLLLGATGNQRLVALAAALAGVVLAGIFVPTFALQVLDVVTILAVLLVLLGWAVHYLGWVRPRDPQVQARRAAREEARLERLRAKPATATADPGGGASSDDATPPAEGGSGHD